MHRVQPKNKKASIMRFAQNSSRNAVPRHASCKRRGNKNTGPNLLGCCRAVCPVQREVCPILIWLFSLCVFCVWRDYPVFVWLVLLLWLFGVAAAVEQRAGTRRRWPMPLPLSSPNNKSKSRLTSLKYFLLNKNLCISSLQGT